MQRARHPTPAHPTPSESAWGALGGDAAPVVELLGEARFTASPFALDAIAVASVASALAAAAELAEARGMARPAPSVEASHVVLAFASERHLRAEHALGSAFAPLSRFAPAADGYLRSHANYPHHRAALMRALGDPGDERAALAAIRAGRKDELEQAVFAAGGVAAAVRSERDWLAHPQGRAVAEQPLLDIVPGPASARPLPPCGDLPCSGLRVLDLTRVIAGPVATRMLAALGAEVLRVDAPQLPELELHILDGTIGKRSALLDLRTDDGRAALERLLAGADVLVQGYRPGALAAFGLDHEALSARHPHLVTATLSAWGHVGPWAERRGFDSIVQAACGIALACGADGEPDALPVQAIDHASGYLAAAAAMRGLVLRARSGHAAHARLALARTAAWIVSFTGAAIAREPELDPASELDPAPYLVGVDSPAGRLSCLRPPGSLDGRPLLWPRGVPAAGSDSARW